MKCPLCEMEIPDHAEVCPECGNTELSPVAELEKDNVSEKNSATSVEALGSPAETLLSHLRTQQEVSPVVPPVAPPPDEPSESSILTQHFDLLKSLQRADEETTEWVAVAKDSGKEVGLLKVESPDEEKQDEAYERALRALDFNHRNVMPVYGVHEGEGDSSFWISMEPLLEGSLADYLAEKEKVTRPVAVALMCGLARGVAYIHQKHFIHNALRPINIFLRKEGKELVPKIGVFGSERDDGDNRKVYLAPEQSEENVEESRAADIFSLGRIFYQMVTGDTSPSIDLTLLKHRPRKLVHVIKKCLEENPDDRYATADELLSDLEKLSKEKKSESKNQGLEEQIICPNCGSKNDGDAKFCEICSAGLIVLCGECGAENSVAEPMCSSCNADIHAFTEAMQLLIRLKRFKTQKKWKELSEKETTVRSLVESLKGNRGRTMAQELVKHVEEAKKVLSEIKLHQSILDQAREAKDHASFIRAAEELSEWVSLSDALKREVDEVKLVQKKEIETIDALVATPPAKAKEKRTRTPRRVLEKKNVFQSLLIGTAIITAGLLLGLGIHQVVSLSRKNSLQKALVSRDVPVALALSEKLQGRYNSVNDAQMLKLVVETQTQMEKELQQRAVFLAKYNKDVWEKANALKETAAKTSEMVAALSLYRELDTLLQNADAPRDSLLGLQDSWEALIADEAELDRLKRFFPEQWTSIELNVKAAHAESDILQAESFWRSILEKTQSLKQEATQKGLSEKEMVLSQNAWGNRVRAVQKENPEYFEGLERNQPELIQQITHLEKLAAAQKAGGAFSDAEKTYKKLCSLLDESVEGSKGWKKSQIYQEALEKAEKFAEKMEWQAALLALDEADKSGSPDRSKAATLREKIELKLKFIRGVRKAYLDQLKMQDSAELSLKHPDQWARLQTLLARAEKEKNPIKASQLYVEARVQLAQIVAGAADSKKVTQVPSFTDRPKVGNRWISRLETEVQMDFLPLKPATFFMGEQTGVAYEKPMHPVTISQPFWMSQYETTLRQFSIFLKSGGLPPQMKIDWRTFSLTPETFQLSKNRSGSGWDHPVCSISWDMAMRFCEWMTEQAHATGQLAKNFRYTLPTEAQWEYACRAGSVGAYAGELEQLGWYKDNSGGSIQPVGQKAPNAWGFFDMHGNAAEWVADHWHNDYYGAPSDGTAWLSPGSAYRVFRSGSAYNSANYCKSTSRGRALQKDKSSRRGFRVVLIKDE